MPTDAPAADSPQVAHYKSRKAELENKLKRLDGMRSTPEFDTGVAKQRTKNMIAEIDAELRRLSAAK